MCVWEYVFTCDNDAQAEILKEWDGVDRGSQWLWVWDGVGDPVPLCVSLPSSHLSSWQHFSQSPLTTVNDRSKTWRRELSSTPCMQPLTVCALASHLPSGTPLCMKDQVKKRAGCGGRLPWVPFPPSMVWGLGQPPCPFQPRPPHL